MLGSIRRSIARFYNSNSIPVLRRRIRERDAWLLLREQTIQELERAVAEREHTVVERELAVTTREQTIRELEVTLDDMRALNQSDGDKNRLISQLRDELATHRLKIDDSLNSHTSVANYPAAQVIKTTEELSIALAHWKELIAAERFIQAGAQRFLDPYIVRKNLAGVPTYILISTQEGRIWYDRFELTDVPYLQMLGMIRPGDVVLDCGSNQGINSLMYSSIVGAAGHVHAFDPFPINCAIAKFNAKVNDRDNITVHQKALSNREMALSISVGAQDILENQDSDDAITATAVTIDSLIALKPNFIKIDVEGAEIDVLEGAAATLKLEPFIYLETHPEQILRFGSRVDEIFDLIDLQTYTCLINYPGHPMFVEYTKQYDLNIPCQMFFLPKSAPPVTRFF
jgi:FkbM family methyltransferase